MIQTTRPDAALFEVGTAVGCPVDTCPSHEEEKVMPEHPRFAEHWSRMSAAAYTRSGSWIEAAEVADDAMAAYRQRFPA
jgi:hypothetical protein